ncbi:head-tail adaptor protein [Brucella intermedia GD04153]|uniref:Head-tail adaptor protein n=1 Tax=Brucella intermedia GD04153 TaxID=2975438 RepID=A0AA42H1L7_9HYPH|nr:head-tail adaptor protein [Brucella intermedia]MDH0126675.1 head-tail adaptor protein [Brucella intermedia GD04153]
MADNRSAGTLYYKVECQSREKIDDGMGNEISGPWETRFTTRAAFRHLRGGETVMASRLQNKHPMIITVRRSSNTMQITTDWILVDSRNGKVYEIRDITPELDRQYLSLLVESGVAS